MSKPNQLFPSQVVSGLWRFITLIDRVDIDLIAVNQLHAVWLETDLEFTTTRGDAVVFHPSIDFLCESREVSFVVWGAFWTGSGIVVEQRNCPDTQTVHSLLAPLRPFLALYQGPPTLADIMPPKFMEM